MGLITFLLQRGRDKAAAEERAAERAHQEAIEKTRNNFALFDTFAKSGTSDEVMNQMFDNLIKPSYDGALGNLRYESLKGSGIKTLQNLQKDYADKKISLEQFQDGVNLLKSTTGDKEFGSGLLSGIEGRREAENTATGQNLTALLTDPVWMKGVAPEAQTAMRQELARTMPQPKSVQDVATSFNIFGDDLTGGRGKRGAGESSSEPRLWHNDAESTLKGFYGKFTDYGFELNKDMTDEYAAALPLLEDFRKQGLDPNAAAKLARDTAKKMVAGSKPPEPKYVGDVVLPNGKKARRYMRPDGTSEYEEIK